MSRDDGCRYAVKRLRTPYRGAGDRRSKIREVEKHEKLPSHPNLVSFNMAWEEDNVLYIQTELCVGSLAMAAKSRRILLKAHMWDILRDALKVGVAAPQPWNHCRFRASSTCTPTVTFIWT